MEKVCSTLLISVLILSAVVAGAEGGRAMRGEEVYVPERLLGMGKWFPPLPGFLPPGKPRWGPFGFGCCGKFHGSKGHKKKLNPEAAAAAIAYP